MVKRNSTKCFPFKISNYIPSIFITSPTICRVFFFKKMKGRRQLFSSLNMKRFQHLTHKDISPPSWFDRCLLRVHVQELPTCNNNIKSSEVRPRIFFARIEKSENIQTSDLAIVIWQCIQYTLCYFKNNLIFLS